MIRSLFIITRPTLLLAYMTLVSYAGVVEDIVELRDLGLTTEGLLLAAKDGKMSFGPSELKKLKEKGFSEDFLELLDAHTKSLEKESAGSLLMVEAVGEQDPISLKVISAKKGAVLLLDGKVVEKIENDGVRLKTTPGWHEIGLQWEGGEFKKEIRVTEKNFSIIHLFAEVPLDENSEEIARVFLEEDRAREIRAFKNNSLFRPIKSRSGITRGREIYRHMKAEASGGMKILDETRVRIDFKGVRERQIENGPTLSSSEMVFFTLEVNEKGEVTDRQILEPWVYKHYQNIVKEVEDLDRDYATIRAFNKANDLQANLKIIVSPAAKKVTRSFQLSLPHSEAIYTLGFGEWPICPLSRPYVTKWVRKGLDAEGELILEKDSRLLIVLHSNWLGDKTKIYQVSDDLDLAEISYENYKEKLNL